MTAEIAVLNKSAVALAADSTVTIGDVSDQSDKRAKTYQSVNKLFTLSKHHPVGVMIYGNAELIGVPWETLIKQYRKQLSSKEFATIEDYSNDFIAFLENSRSVFTDEWQRANFTAIVHSYLVEVVAPKVEAAVEAVFGSKGGPLAEEAKIAGKVIREHWNTLDANTPVLPHLGTRFEQKVVRAHAKEVAVAIKDSFERARPLTAATVKAVERIAARVICGEIFPDDGISGVVIAGFGADQVFPQVWCMSPHCVTADRLIYRTEPRRCQAIDHRNQAVLIPFAQTDVVHTFLRGLDTRYSEMVVEAAAKFIADFPGVVAQHISSGDNRAKARITKKISAEMTKALKGVTKEIQKYQYENHVAPLLDTIAMLPKNELAETAEALVNLTSLKRKMSVGIETVGGPIDVAVISKGDGFVWIRRKHYFKSELNPHFVRNYMREYRNGPDR